MIRLIKLPAFVLLLLCCVLPLNEATATEPSLYSPEDNVKILNNDTLEIELYSSPNCKLVQFINYFCGDCRRFAATFKQVAWKLYEWSRVLSVYVVDCAQERNVQICRDFDVQKTPTLRIFPPRFQRTEQEVGFDLDTLVPNTIFAQLAEYISKVKYTTLDGPDFEPVDASDNIITLLQRINFCNSNTFNYIVLLYQPEGSTIGRDTILGLLTWPTVAVRYLSDRQLFSNFFLSPISEKLVIIDCVGNVLALKPFNDTSAAYVTIVGDYLHASGYTAMAPLSTTPAPNVTSYLIDEEQAAILSTVLRGGPKVYRADLEQAIDKLLHIELPKVRIFKGDSMMALRQLLNVLRLFSPLNASGKLLLQRLYEFVNGSSGELTGVAFQAQVHLAERMLPKVFKARRYVGCIASGPFLRGFTCSLWTLFHYLTVQSAKSPVLPAGFVLGTIHGFVKHFFGCRDCVQHFVGMAERRRIFSVNSRDEEILWLWEAHNEVNQRLAGDTTEDPKFPKLQFPSLSACDSCQVLTPQNTTWRRTVILSFLKGFYDVTNLSYYGLPTTNGYN